jgi:hypothetical protein
VGLAVFKIVARPPAWSWVGSTPIHLCPRQEWHCQCLDVRSKCTSFPPFLAVVQPKLQPNCAQLFSSSLSTVTLAGTAGEGKSSFMRAATDALSAGLTWL